MYFSLIKVDALRQDMVLWKWGPLALFSMHGASPIALYVGILAYHSLPSCAVLLYFGKTWRTALSQRGGSSFCKRPRPQLLSTCSPFQSTLQQCNNCQYKTCVHKLKLPGTIKRKLGVVEEACVHPSYLGQADDSRARLRRSKYQHSNVYLCAEDSPRRQQRCQLWNVGTSA